MARLHALIGEHLDVQDDGPAGQVKIGIETDRGPWVQALIAAGYQVYAVNPLQAARFRERISVSGAKSNPGGLPHVGGHGPDRLPPAAPGGR